MNTNLVMTGPTLDVHVEDGKWWATCPGCPGWTACADSWKDLFRLVTEWHRGDAKHRAWIMISPITVGS